MLKQILIISVIALIASADFKTSILEDLLLLKDRVRDEANPTHYGNPKTGCQDDEISGGIEGIKGEGCFPDCTDHDCPTDYPEGDTAPGVCAVNDDKHHKKYCIL